MSLSKGRGPRSRHDASPGLHPEVCAKYVVLFIKVLHSTTKISHKQTTSSMMEVYTRQDMQ